MTIAWSNTFEIELPEGLTAEDLEDTFFEHPDIKEINQRVNSAIKASTENISWKDMEITDLQEEIEEN